MRLDDLHQLKGPGSFFVGLKAIISDGKIASKTSQETIAALPSAKSPCGMLQELSAFQKDLLFLTKTNETFSI